MLIRRLASSNMLQTRAAHILFLPKKTIQRFGRNQHWYEILLPIYMPMIPPYAYSVLRHGH